MQILFIYIPPAEGDREIYHFNRNNNKMDQLKFIYRHLSILVRETLSFGRQAAENCVVVVA